MRWIWISVSSLAVLAAAAAVVLHLTAKSEPAQEEAEGPKLVKQEHSYYVLLPKLEVNRQMEGGTDWDSGGSAPDLYYEVHWQGHKVFTAGTKEDTLVAQWSNVSFDLGDLLDSISLDDSIKAARITVRSGGKLTFRVYDSDLAGDDLAGEWDVEVETLRLGDQKWERPAGDVTWAVCRVLPLDSVEFDALTK
ncbi:MAG: hypothetical protein ACYSX0_14180 [Planctomycetota bacterium]